MAASELSVQPQLAQARAVRGIAAVSGINKQHKTSGVAAPRRAIAEIFIASPEKRKGHRCTPSPKRAGPRRLSTPDECAVGVGSIQARRGGPRGDCWRVGPKRE